MRLENLPILLGIIVALVGVGLMADAWIADGTFVGNERRRRTRLERDHTGEGVMGIGTVFFAIALIGRDWRFGTIFILLGAVLCAVGVWRNRRFLKDMVRNRGAARRSDVPIDTLRERPARKTRIR